MQGPALKLWIFIVIYAFCEIRSSKSALLIHLVCVFNFRVNHSPCITAFFFNRRSSLSTWSSSGTQQSTGQTAAHCGSSWKPLHSVHLSGTIKYTSSLTGSCDSSALKVFPSIFLKSPESFVPSEYFQSTAGS